MSRRGKDRRRPAAPSKAVSNPDPDLAQKPTLSRGRLWRLRLTLLAGVPAAFLALLEVGLRIGGFGYPTAFLLERPDNGHTTLVQNNRFGWRFFGPRMSRLPCPISIPQPKAAGTVRIFVFGESAAYGDPEPAFGLSRMLEALLSLRHPGVRFEVINAAMTGINSHTILPIARDCAQADGDIWVIYMGNNEVVGPFGAGTVFDRQVPPMPIIRANLALKAFRFGQLLDDLGRRVRGTSSEGNEWGGMLMFVQQQVRAGDPRMNAVYRHFQRNLADILQAGQRQGCGIVLSTVAVNLRDCPPFGSQHRPDLSREAQAQWEQWFKQGVEAQRANQMPAAAAAFQQAAQLDDTFAELRFRQGQCALALERIAEAQAQFKAARDLDTLRFRCDSRLNELVRQTAANHQEQRVILADAEQAFAAQSSDGLPGQDFFYEHVHLTFEGNYLLARTIAPQVEGLLPKHIASMGSPEAGWPSRADCAQHLAWSQIELRSACNEMLVRVSDPPFTSQLNHDAQIARLTALSQARESADAAAELSNALKQCEQASTRRPDDPVLQELLASLKQSSGDPAGAAAAMQRSLDLLSTSSEGWGRLGLILVQEKQFAPAAAAFQREFELDPQDVSALQNLAMCLVKEDRIEEAIGRYRRALAIKPRFGPAWLGLGQALESSGRKDEALDCFQKALVNRMHRAADLVTLARFCTSKGWFDAAVTNYIDALKLGPPDATLDYEVGQNLSASGRHGEAARYYAEAAMLAPNWAQAQFQWGLELGISGHPQEASSRFQEAVRLMPDLLEARLNLGIALLKETNYPAALAQFEQVLQRSPTNAIAAQYVKALSQKTPRQP